MNNKPMTQDGAIVREMTDKEFTEYQELQEELALNEQAKAAQNVTRLAIIQKLGITEDELRQIFI